MNSRVELPLVEPLYSTFHNQGAATSIIVSNPSVRNWYLNQIMNLTCSRKFLNGFTTPEINITDSSWISNPYLDKQWVPTEFTNGCINQIIREMLDRGFYVLFSGVDDFYVEGKSWYKQRHFNHDGLICGYDRNDKTYCIYAYDENWIYQKFWTPQKCFNAGRISMYKKGAIIIICGLKVNEDKVDFSPKIACQNIKKYLDSTLEKYPFDGEGNVCGIAVHVYIAEYVKKLYNGDIPYERIDRRVFRMIWEHKKVMMERILKIEQYLQLTDEISKKYEQVVSSADTIRMLYASHHMKRRDCVLPVIKNKLLNLMEQEKKLLTILIEKAGKESGNETLDVFEE